jgi:intron-binding protein aquarius
MDQSLFARFVRLGVPTVMLDAQGRSRPSLARLFNWRYSGLQDLPQVTTHPEFRAANAGLRYEYQLVDVGDFHGRGEYEPSPYFYQNLGEAEFVCATFQYMRLLGYPAHSISVITSYNGQKNLLRDVFRRRCANHPMFGLPHKISTLDRFQGQQNDYVLFSMVRTKAVGHIRDVRRLIVGMSRARLGFYVFCRKALFENCYELTPAFAHLVRRPSRLHLVPNEVHPTTRLMDQEEDVQSFVVDNVEHMQALVASHAARIQAALIGAPLISAPDAAVADSAEAETAGEEGVKKRKQAEDGEDGGEGDQEAAPAAQDSNEQQQQSKKRRTASKDGEEEEEEDDEEEDQA